MKNAFEFALFSMWHVLFIVIYGHVAQNWPSLPLLALKKPSCPPCFFSYVCTRTLCGVGTNREREREGPSLFLKELSRPKREVAYGQQVGDEKNERLLAYAFPLFAAASNGREQGWLRAGFFSSLSQFEPLSLSFDRLSLTLKMVFFYFFCLFIILKWNFAWKLSLNAHQKNIIQILGSWA